MLRIINATLHTITGGTVPGGSLLVRDGRIAALGTNVPDPPGARVLDAAGGVVTPGLIDAHTHLGVYEEGIGDEGKDINESVDPATPHVRAIDGINPRDRAFPDALAAGITAAWVAPGSANVIGGQACTIRTWGRTVEDMLLLPFSAVKAALGENPKRVHGGAKGKIATRMGNAGVFREWFWKARNYLERQERARRQGDDPPEPDLRLEPLTAALRGEVPVRVHGHRADDILTAIRLCREFDLRFTLEHCTEGHLVADILSATPGLLGVVVGPTMSARSKVELMEKTFLTPGELARAGLRTAIMTDHPVVPVQYLPLAAALSVREGMDRADALRAITLAAAEICGVGDRLGSLEVGKEADLAVFTGHPFDLETRTVATVVAGEVVYEG